MNSNGSSRRAYGFKDKMTVSEKIFFVAAFVLSAFLTAIIQTCFFFNFRPFGFAPDLCLALTVAVGVKFGHKSGGIIGLLSGFFIDCFSASGFSLAIPFYVILGIAVGFLAGESAGINLPSLVIFALGVLSGVLADSFLSTVGICLTFSSFNIGDVLFKTVLPEALCTALFSILVYAPVALFFLIIKKKQGVSYKTIKK